jgi:hypothetical protein
VTVVSHAKRLFFDKPNLARASPAALARASIVFSDAIHVAVLHRSPDVRRTGRGLGRS